MTLRSDSEVGRKCKIGKSAFPSHLDSGRKRNTGKIALPSHYQGLQILGIPPFLDNPQIKRVKWERDANAKSAEMRLRPALTSGIGESPVRRIRPCDSCPQITTSRQEARLDWIRGTLGCVYTSLFFDGVLSWMAMRMSWRLARKVASSLS